MTTLANTSELSELVNQNEIQRYKICIDFPHLYIKAEEAGDLEQKKIKLLINNEKKIEAFVRVTPAEYGVRAGLVIEPELLKDEIVDYIPNIGWVIAEISNNMWY